MDNKIVIKGARENNLKNIDVEIPKNQLVVFSGLSGSGKTTLAFETIFAEGQRRYMESLSSYARQFLGSFEKPDVDAIEGLSPAISIDQKTTSHNPRSTVGTVTEIYDYLRLLFANVGVPICPHHNIPIVSFTVTQMTDMVMALPEGTKVQLLSPVIHHEKGTQKDVLDKLRAIKHTEPGINLFKGVLANFIKALSIVRIIWRGQRFILDSCCFAYFGVETRCVS